MARGKNNFHTVYHVMDERGQFRSNPANPDSVDPVEGISLYKGPVSYPRMFYHPQCLERVIVPGRAMVNPVTGELLLDRNGDQIVRGEQREIVWELAASPEDEARLRASGWHDHPARALQAAGKEAPAMSSAQTIEELERKLVEAQRQLNAAQAPAGPGQAGKKSLDPVLSGPAV